MLRDDASELDWLLFHQSDVLSRAQALRFHSRAAIEHRLANRRWQRPHRGVYLTTTSAPTPEQENWIAVLAAGDGAVLAGSSAPAWQYRLSVAGRSGIHLLVRSNVRRLALPIAVIPHRTAVLPDADVHHLGSPPCTMPARSTVDAAAWARSDEQAIAVVAAAFQRRLVTLAEIEDVLDRLPTVRRRATIRRAAIDAAGGSHSLAEVEYLRLNRAHGLPEPTRQLRRVDARGARRYLDIYYEEYGLQVEIDGGQHAEVRAAWDDMRRQNDLWIAGDRVLRFPTWLVRERPNDVFAQVRSALAAAGWNR